ncbi:MAG TPA: ABC transporter permease [Acidobacteriaceae bacterium]|nr:ABC transporter permease [Acidobacteriaceae bacterium]
MLADLKYGLRQFRKSPGFAITALLTLALGIGANTAIYSIIHGTLRLPFAQADRMAAIQNVFPQGSYYAASYPDFEEWRTRAHSFSSLVALFPSRATWIPSGYGKTESEAVRMAMVSDGYFAMYGIHPVLGRGFLASEHVKGAPPVCLVSEAFWREELNADASVLNRPLNLDGKVCTVVGVAPVVLPAGNRATQVWIPLEPNRPWDQHGTNYLFVSGLLRPGATLAQAQAELSGIQAQIDKQFPDNKHGIGVHWLNSAYFGDLRSLMNILLAAVGFILLIACVNLANMQLARAADRSREFAVRRALGASPGRMLRQTLTESLLLSVTGAALGLAVAVGLTHIPIAAWPKGMVAPAAVGLDGWILAFTAILGVGTGVLFGMAPGLRVLRERETPALQPGRTATESREHRRTRGALVVAEIAISMLLVAGAVNVALHFASVLSVDPGVRPENTMVMSVTLPAAQYATPDSQRNFYRTLEPRLAALPGVTAVGGGVDTPFTGTNATGDFQYEGQPNGTADKNPFAEKHAVTPGFFAAVGAPILEGRDFNEQDQANSQPVVILNRSMVEKLWPGQNPIGKHIKDGNVWEQVVGVVGDIHYSGPAEPVGYQIYQSVNQAPPPYLTFVLRTSPHLHTSALTLAEPARKVVASIDPRLAVSNITSLELLAQDAIAGQRTSTLVTAILGCLALLLASIGVYGVMAYTVSRRVREFGIRIALGSDRAGIVRLLFRGVLRLALLGIVLGAGLAYAARLWVNSLMGAGGSSPAALVLGALLMSAVAAIATLLPARRAMRVEPMEALRSE